MSSSASHAKILNVPVPYSPALSSAMLLLCQVEVLVAGQRNPNMSDPSQRRVERVLDPNLSHLSHLSHLSALSNLSPPVTPVTPGHQIRLGLFFQLAYPAVSNQRNSTCALRCEDRCHHRRKHRRRLLALAHALLGTHGHVWGLMLLIRGGG